MRGHFTSPLFEGDSNDTSPGNWTRRSVGQVSGSFVSAALVAFYENDPASNIDDIKARLFDHVPPEVLARLDYGTMPAAMNGIDAGESSGTPAGGGTSSPSDYSACSCACSEIATPTEAACAPICRVHYAVCTESTPTEADLTAPLDHLVADAPPDVVAPVRQQYLGEFGGALDEEKRQMRALLKVQTEGV